VRAAAHRGAVRAALAALALALLGAAGGCAPTIMPPGPPGPVPPALTTDGFLAADDVVLPLRTWLPDGPPRAVIVALHGFNDYSHFFAKPGAFLAKRGIASYAYDQRGFGETPERRYWPGVAGLVGDARTFTRLIRARYPGVPVYLLGESMGGAVAMVAMAGTDPPPVNGVILAAPAVWGRSTMPFYQRWALAIAAHTVPWMTVTGRGLGIRPSDNRQMLIALARDRWVIKETRIDAVWGLTNLMDAALAAAPRITAPALVLYGRHDQVIPSDPTLKMMRELPATASGRQRLAIYKTGYHMLLRDLEAKTVWTDIAAWIADPTAPLPSGADKAAAKVLARTAQRR